jgi:hypothetical protein
VKIIIKVKEGQLEVPPESILNEILTKFTSNSKTKHSEFEDIVDIQLNSFEKNNSLSGFSIKFIAWLFFGLGYYWRIFKEKNTVEIIRDSHE